MKRSRLIYVLVLFMMIFLNSCFSNENTSDEVQEEEYIKVYLNRHSFQGDECYESEYNIQISTRYGAEIYVDSYYTMMYDFYGYFMEKDGKGMQVTDASGKFTDEFFRYCLEHKNYLIDVYPYAIPRDCVITLVSNCGVEFDPIVAKCDSSVTLPNELEKEGYNFKGWSEYPDDWSGSDTYHCNSESVTLYGIFSAKTTIVTCYGQDGRYVADERIYFDSEYDLPYKDYSGYNFLGYYTEENGNGVQLTDKNGNALSAWNISDIACSVYGYYSEANTHIVSIANEGLKSYIEVVYMYYSGEESENYVRRTYSDSKNITYLEPQYIPKGYVFAGWYHDPQLSEPFLYTETVDDDLVLYPKFEEVKGYDDQKHYTFINQEITATARLELLQTFSYYYISSFTGTLEIDYVLDCPYDDKADFSVWNVTTNKRINAIEIPNGEKRSCTLQVSCGDIICIMVEGYTNGQESQMIYYTLKGCDLNKLEADVNIPDYFEVKVTEGSHFTLPVYKHSGYVFNGYYTSRNGNGVRLTNSDGESLAPYESTDSITVYAYYIKSE